MAQSLTERPGATTACVIDELYAQGLLIPSAAGVMFETGQDAGVIVKERGLAQISDSGALGAIVDQVIAANPGPVADYRAGKAAALNFLKGQVMKLSKGKANPALVGEILEKKLRG